MKEPRDRGRGMQEMRYAALANRVWPGRPPMTANVLVTGESGLIGRRVVEMLVEQGHRAIVYDLAPNYRDLRDVADKVQVVAGDVTDLPCLLATLRRERIDHIVHLAAIVTRAAKASPGAVFRVNVGGTLNVFDAALATGVRRVVWTSSISALGVGPDYDGRPVDESYRVASRSPYGASKWACEVAAEAYASEFGLDVVGIRPATTYGLGRLGGGGPGFFAEAIRRLAIGEPARIVAARAGLMQPMYDRDMARLLLATLFGSRPRHIIYNHPAERSYSDDEVLAVLRAVCPGAVLTLDPPLEFVAPMPIVDGSLARRELDFTPAYSLKDGVAEMVAHFRTQPGPEPAD
jgi:nucleoside-diphosphate-sugar epimerase